MNNTDFYVDREHGSNLYNSGDSAGLPIPRTGTVDPYDLTHIVCADGWSGIEVGRMLLWAVGGASELRRVEAINGNVLTVDAPVSHGEDIGLNIGGPFSTMARAASVVTTSMVNAAGDPPAINVRAKNDAGQYMDYVEEIALANSGTTACPITVRPYVATAGDCTGTNIRFRLRPAISDTAALNITGQHVIVQNLDAETATAGDFGIYINANYVKLLNVRGKGPQGGIRIYNNQYIQVCGGLFEESGANGSYCASLAGRDSVYEDIIVRNGNAGAYGMLFWPFVSTYRNIRVEKMSGRGLVTAISSGTSAGSMSNIQISDCGGAGIDFGGSAFMSNFSLKDFIIANCANFGITCSGTAKRYMRIKNGTIYNCGTPINPLIYDNAEGLLTVDPFTGADQAARAANNYQKAAAVKGKSLGASSGIESLTASGDYTYPDLGWPQEQPSAGGGMQIHTGMSGGING